MTEYLFELAKARILDGSLPSARSAQVTGGHGLQGPCRVCGEAFKRGEFAYEAIMLGPAGLRSALPFHGRCFSAWDRARHH